ncbi:MAG TPA: amidohydrolase family protein [Acidobacteriota bacterium]|nr:amidohydrolase family protein [Acidobacteriota bacterium]
MRRSLLFSLLFFLIWSAVLGFLPRNAQAQNTIAIRNARIVTVSGPVIEKGTVLIESDQIVAVGEVEMPEEAQVFEAAGLTIYPGLFDAQTTLGLSEIGAVQMSNDFQELGEFTPQLRAFEAIHADSEQIPVARANGITHVVSLPNGGTIPGQAVLFHLDGVTPEQMVDRKQAALVLDFPTLLPASTDEPFRETRQRYAERIQEIKSLFERARHYERAKKTGSRIIVREYEALIPYLNEGALVIIQVNRAMDIKNAVTFAQEEELNYVLMGAVDAWKVADFLSQHKSRVILGPLQRLPIREDDPVDIIYRTPSILAQHGVPFAITTDSVADVRNLPYEAGNAVAYGLSWEAALHSITLAPARFFGVDDRLGSIDVGKLANLVLVRRDLLDFSGEIIQVFIRGKSVDLENRHTRLYKRYLRDQP